MSLPTLVDLSRFAIPTPDALSIPVRSEGYGYLSGMGRCHFARHYMTEANGIKIQLHLFMLAIRLATVRSGSGQLVSMAEMGRAPEALRTAAGCSRTLAPMAIRIASQSIIKDNKDNNMTYLYSRPLLCGLDPLLDVLDCALGVG
jgi:hypothetical protein